MLAVFIGVVNGLDVCFRGVDTFLYMLDTDGDCLSSGYGDEGRESDGGRL
jgi:hypothetical protein